jgi:rfaE bifunctional protein nucleotidyltransferase chain/domain
MSAERAGARTVVVGDALLDRDVEGRSERLAPDVPVPVLDELGSRQRPGGAGLAAVLAARDGSGVTLVTALAPDAAGAELGRALLAAGVNLVDLGLDGSTPEKIRMLDGGRPLMRLDRGGGVPAASAAGVLPALRSALASADAVLVSDYGRGIAAQPDVRAVLRERAADAPIVWDPHPRGPDPVPGVALATPNLDEARRFASGRGEGAEELAAVMLDRWRVEAVCVTCGPAGAALAAPGAGSASVAATPVEGDPCGAGDRFAVEAVSALASGAPVREAVERAVAAATSFVAAGGAAGVRRKPSRAAAAWEPQGLGSAPLSIEPALEQARRVRAAGGTVVATGGCFDLLHVGHVRTLEAARRLGDSLVVLLNSDRSVSELKGSDRPLVGELERAAMLKGLACVDEVAIFDEETPVDALRLLRPDVWAKGGDYELDRLPEGEVVAEWGGRTAILPYVEGRSTTRLIEEVGLRGE